MGKHRNQLGRWLLNQQIMQRRAVPKRPAGDRCGLSNAPAEARDSEQRAPKFRSRQSSELLINRAANRGRRGKQRRVGVAFENESDSASRRFFHSRTDACLLVGCSSTHGKGREQG